MKKNVSEFFFNFLVSVGASMVAYYIYKWLNRNDRTTEHKRVDWLPNVIKGNPQLDRVD